MILTWNLSKNKSVGKDLYKCKEIRWFQEHRQLLGQGRRKVIVSKKVFTRFNITVGKKRRIQCATKMERQGKIFGMILRFEIDLRSIQIPFHFGVPPVLLLGQLEQNTVMTVFNIFTLIKFIWLIFLRYFVVFRAIWKVLEEIVPCYASANTEIPEIINHVLLTEYRQGVNGF